MPEVFGSGWHSCRDAGLNIVLLCFILSRTICSARGSEGQIGRMLRPTNLEGAGNSQLTLCPVHFLSFNWVKTSAGERESTLKVHLVTRSRSSLGMPGCTGATRDMGKIQHDLPLKWLNTKWQPLAMSPVGLHFRSEKSGLQD